MKNFTWLVWQIVDIISILVLVVFAATFAMLVWRIIDAFILNGGDSMKVEEGKKTVLIGFIVLVVMSSIWGIIALLKTAIN